MTGPGPPSFRRFLIPNATTDRNKSAGRTNPSPAPADGEATGHRRPLFDSVAPSARPDADGDVHGNDYTVPHKRRWVMHQEATQSPHTDGPKSTAPRFTLSTPAQNPPVIERPRPSFLRAETSPMPQLDPLPEAFSPRRRGQPFVPGGMAAEVQSWIVNVGSSIEMQARHRQEATVKAVLAVTAVHADAAVLLVQGRDKQGAMIKAVLAEKPNSKAVLRPGQTVKLHDPVWSIDLAGEAYLVAVDWQSM